MLITKLCHPCLSAAAIFPASHHNLHIFPAEQIPTTIFSRKFSSEKVREIPSTRAILSILICNFRKYVSADASIRSISCQDSSRPNWTDYFSHRAISLQIGFPIEENFSSYSVMTFPLTISS